MKVKQVLSGVCDNYCCGNSTKIKAENEGGIIAEACSVECLEEILAEKRGKLSYNDEEHNEKLKRVKKQLKGVMNKINEGNIKSAEVKVESAKETISQVREEVGLE